MELFRFLFYFFVFNWAHQIYIEYRFLGGNCISSRSRRRSTSISVSISIIIVVAVVVALVVVFFALKLHYEWPLPEHCNPRLQFPEVSAQPTHINFWQH